MCATPIGIDMCHASAAALLLRRRGAGSRQADPSTCVWQNLPDNGMAVVRTYECAGPSVRPMWHQAYTGRCSVACSAPFRVCAVQLVELGPVKFRDWRRIFSIMLHGFVLV